MKKTITKLCISFTKIFIILLVYSTFNRANSQVVNTYSFSQTTGTYTPITTGPVLGVATNDDSSFPANPIGFSFTYGGTTYTTFSVNSNGFLALGSTVNSSYSVISTGGNNIVSALNADLQGLPSVGQMRYDTIGTAPNRTLVMQWKNYAMYSSSTNSLDSFDFQIRLNETSNSVEIMYGRFVKTSGGNSVQVGVKGSSSAIYLNRTSTSSWTTTTAGTSNTNTVTFSNTVLPTNGLTFTFTPPTPAAPTVFTGTKTNITTNTVTLAGSIAINQYPVITTSGVIVGTSANPTIGGSGVIDSTTNPVVTTGSFTKNIAGLSNSTLYYYRAYAINSVGTTYGADSTFTTNSSAVIPTVNKLPVTNLLTTSASLNANISSDGGSTVTASGFVYSTITNPFLFGTSVIDSTTSPVITTGNFTVSPAGLVHSTKYYYKAYATNGIGTAYSVQDSFITDPIISAMPYFQNFDSLNNTGFKSNFVTGATNDWVVGTPTKTNLSAAFSSPNAWVTKTSGNYTIISPNDAAVVSPQFNFSTHIGDPVLRFQHKFRLSPFGAGY
ncbi:MAG: hypothetical protein K9G64_04500, partial [Bacteroidia bacterium]|nr:hypothetical protein [Bacteroidia bacterium]